VSGSSPKPDRPYRVLLHRDFRLLWGSQFVSLVGTQMQVVALNWHVYLLTRRLERAAALLRTTDRSIADICFSVGLQSIGSFTTSFTRMFGQSPAAYRASFPPAVSRVVVPSCVVRAYGRPQHRPAERG